MIKNVIAEPQFYGNETFLTLVKGDKLHYTCKLADRFIYLTGSLFDENCNKLRVHAVEEE